MGNNENTTAKVIRDNNHYSREVKMKKQFILLVVVALLSGCATPVTHNTPSGRPEVTINGVPPNKVSARLTNEMLNWGYNIRKQSDNLIAFDRPTDNLMASALLGSRYDSTPNARITFMLAELGNSTRVVADLQIVTNPGSAFERLTNMNQSQDSRKIQEMLQRIKYQLEQ